MLGASFPRGAGVWGAPGGLGPVGGPPPGPPPVGVDALPPPESALAVLAPAAPASNGLLVAPAAPAASLALLRLRRGRNGFFAANSSSVEGSARLAVVTSGLGSLWVLGTAATGSLGL